MFVCSVSFLLPCIKLLVDNATSRIQVPSDPQMKDTHIHQLLLILFQHFYSSMTSVHFPALLAQHPKSALNFSCSVTFSLFNNPKLPSHLVVFLISCLGKWPMAALPKISHGWSPFLLPKHGEYPSISLLFVCQLACGDPKVLPFLPLPIHWQLGSRTNWGTGPQHENHPFKLDTPHQQEIV